MHIYWFYCHRVKELDSKPMSRGLIFQIIWILVKVHSLRYEGCLPSFFFGKKMKPHYKMLINQSFSFSQKKKKTQSFSFINVLFNMQLQLGTHVENSKIYRQTFMFAHKYTQLLLLKEEKKKN